MITGSYDLDTVEETFDVALEIDLSFKMLVNAKARCAKCEEHGHYDYQCPSESQHVRIVPSDDVDSKIVKDVYVPSKTASIIEAYQLVLTHRLLIRSTYLLIEPDVDDTVDHNMPALPSKSFEFPCADIVL